MKHLMTLRCEHREKHYIVIVEDDNGERHWLVLSKCPECCVKLYKYRKGRKLLWKPIRAALTAEFAGFPKERCEHGGTIGRDSKEEEIEIRFNCIHCFGQVPEWPGTIAYIEGGKPKRTWRVTKEMMKSIKYLPEGYVFPIATRHRKLRESGGSGSNT